MADALQVEGIVKNASDLASQLYHSGVGWSNDIFDCEIFIDTETESHSNIPTYVKQNPFSPSERARKVALRDPDSDTEEGEAPSAPSTAELARRLDGRYQTNIVSLVASGVPIAGFVRVTAPKGRATPVPHGGLTMELKTAFCTADEEASRDVYEENIVLMGAGEVAAGASVDVPFAFLGPAAEPLDESFEGDLFSIRHTVSLTIARPWYTFPVVTTCPVLVQRVHDLRAVLPRAGNGSETHGAGLPLSDASIGGSSLRAPMQPLAADLVKQSDGGLRSALAPLEVAVSGLPGATKAALSLTRALYEVGDSVRGTISVSGAAAPIVLLKLAVVRLEEADGEAANTVVFDESIIDARRWRMRKEGAAALLRLQAERAATLAASAARAAAASGAGVGGGIVSVVSDEVTGFGSSRMPAVGAASPRAAPAAGGADAEAGEGDAEAGGEGDVAAVQPDFSWLPSEEDLEVGDPDLPLVGDIGLEVDLDLSAIRGLTPTLVIPLEDKEGTGASTVTASVRYFVRLTAYTDFTPESRRWAAKELILVRGSLDADIVPPWRRPPPPAEAEAEAEAGAEGAAQALPGGGGLSLFGLGGLAELLGFGGGAAPEARLGAAAETGLDAAPAIDVHTPDAGRRTVAALAPAARAAPEALKPVAAAGGAGAVTSPRAGNPPPMAAASPRGEQSHRV